MSTALRVASVLGARVASALPLLVVSVPALLLAAYVGTFAVDVPFRDQWDIAPFFVEYDRGTLSLGDLFAQQNEYRQLFPNLVFLGLGLLTDWRIQFELAASVLLACVVFAAVAFLAAKTLPPSGRLRLVTLLLAGVLIFSPAQEENWLWGIQLVYFFPIACVALALVTAYSSLPTVAKFLLGATLCVISTFSSANGIVAWIVTLPAFLVLLPDASQRTKRGFAAGWAALLGGCAALYFNGYESPPGHPGMTVVLERPFHALAYLGGFVGSPFGLRAGPDFVAGLTAAVAGVLVGAGFAAACAYVWRQRRRELLERTIGWIALGAYSVGTGVAVAIGRLGYGVGQSLASRYVTFSLYLSVAVVFLAAIVISDLRARRPALPAGRIVRPAVVAAASALVALQPPVYALGVRAMETRNAELLRGKACLLLIDVVRDDRCLAAYVHSDVPALRRRANELDRLGLLHPSLVRPADVPGLLSARAGGAGVFAGLGRVDRHRLVAYGWAALDGRREPAHGVLLAYRQPGASPVVFSLGEVGRGPHIGSVAPSRRWRALFSMERLPGRSEVRLSAWAFDARSGRAFELNGDYAYTRPGSS